MLHQMRVTIVHSKIRRNLVLVDNDSHQRETITQWPICLSLKHRMNKIWSGPLSHMFGIRRTNGLVIDKKSLDIGLIFCFKKILIKSRSYFTKPGGNSQIRRFEFEYPDRSGSQFCENNEKHLDYPPEHYAVTIYF